MKLVVEQHHSFIPCSFGRPRNTEKWPKAHIEKKF